MPNHDAFLKEVQSKLKDGGLLVGSVPIVRYIRHLQELLFKKDWAYREAGVLDRTHLRFFTRESLLASLQSSGYQVEAFEGINPLRLAGRPRKLIFAKIGSYLMTALLGLDTRYLQWGFRVRLGR